MLLRLFRRVSCLANISNISKNPSLHHHHVLSHSHTLDPLPHPFCLLSPEVDTMHFTTFVPLLVVGAAARPALFPTAIGGAIPYPTLLSGTMDPGNMFPSKPGNMLPSLPIHPRKEAEPTSEPSFRSVTEEEDAAKAKEDKKAADGRRVRRRCLHRNSRHPQHRL
jgi:hypothetical protein